MTFICDKTIPQKGAINPAGISETAMVLYSGTTIVRVQLRPYKFVRINSHTLSRIQTPDLSICLYLNLKHGDLDRSTTTASLKACLEA